MKKIIIFTVFQIICFNIYSQSWICGFEDTEKSIPDKKLLKEIDINNPICVNIIFHIIRENNGTGGWDPNKIQEIINDLNYIYNPYNIFFYNLGFDYINNSTYYYFERDEIYSLVNNNRRLDALNIYTVKTSPFQGSAWPNYKSLVIQQDYIMTRILHHEIGHLFGLKHTHVDNPNAIGAILENIEREGPTANCEYAADGLCDTPADPILSNKVNENCEYFKNETLNNQKYNPDANNLMSYSLPHCLTHLYLEQIQIIHYTILNTIEEIISADCTFPSIVGNNSICNLNQSTYTLINNNNPFEWEISLNLRRISSTENSVTIAPNSYIFSKDSIIANINGYLVKKYIDIKRIPILNDSQIKGGYDNVSINSTNVFYVTTAQGTLGYQWSIVHSNNNCNSTQLPQFIGSSTSTKVTVKHGTCIGLYRLRCKSYNNCGDSFYQDKVIYVYDPTTDDPCDPIVNLYPNPSDNSYVILKIDYPGDPCDNDILNSDRANEIRIYDLFGNVLYKESFKTDLFSLESLNLQKGLYMVKVFDKKGRIHDKRLKIK